MKNKIFYSLLIFVIIVQLVGIGILGYDWNKKRNIVEYWENLKFEKLNYVENINIKPEETDIEQIQKVQKSPKDINDVFVTGWIPDWDYDDGFDSLKEQANSFGSISPFWFEFHPDGSLKKNAKTNDQELISFTKENKIELIPTITCFDTVTLSQVLNSEENMQRHIDQIIDQVVLNNYDGIDLDYESIYLKDNQKFFEFLQRLSVEMIKNDKKLVFTVLPKWGDKDVVYLAFPETKKNFDYKKIADLVDELRIMTYEYSGKTSKYYGPIGPLSWLEDVMKYAIATGVPREKIVIGVHTYSYDYTSREKMPKIEFYPVLGTEFDGNKPAALAYYNNIVEKIQKEYNMKVEYEKDWGEAVGTYTDDDGTERIIVFPNQDSLDSRKKLAAEYGIKGVAYWRIGDEGELDY